MVINIQIINSVASIEVFDKNGRTQIKIAGDECETLSTLKDDDFVQFMQQITTDVINVMSKPVVKNLQLRTSKNMIINPDDALRWINPNIKKDGDDILDILSDNKGNEL